MMLRTLSTAALVAALATAASAQSLNELYISHDGTDDMEFIEILGTGSMSLDDHLILEIESDSTSTFGQLEKVYDLTGSSIPADGYFVAGGAAVPTVDLVLGSTNLFENSSATYFLVVTDGSTTTAAVLALAGMDIDTDDNNVIELPAGTTILDMVMASDGGAGDINYNGAPIVGPDGSFLPAGIFRGGDAPNGWCTTAFLDFDDVVNTTEPSTAGAANGACPAATTGTARCFCDAANAACSNNYDTGGCANSTGVGAIISATGSDDVTMQGSDPLVLHITQARPDKNYVVLQGAGASIQSVFKDGNLCVGNPTLRLPGFGCGAFPIGTLDSTGSISTDDATYGFDILAAALCKGDDIAAAVPTTREYQVWFRDGMGPCNTGSNLTNSVVIDWN